MSWLGAEFLSGQATYFLLPEDKLGAVVKATFQLFAKGKNRWRGTRIC